MNSLDSTGQSLSDFAVSQSLLPNVETAGMAFHFPASPPWALSPFLCLPRSRRRISGSGQLAVGQPLTGHTLHDFFELVAVANLAAIVPEGFFIDVPEQVEGLNADVGTLNGSFQEAPKVLDTVGVNLAANVFLSVVD